MRRPYAIKECNNFIYIATLELQYSYYYKYIGNNYINILYLTCLQF